MLVCLVYRGWVSDLDVLCGLSGRVCDFGPVGWGGVGGSVRVVGIGVLEIGLACVEEGHEVGHGLWSCLVWNPVALE